jgi:hypothetical protein
VLSVVEGVVLLSEWSFVEALVALESDWSPVVAVVLLESDWSPVDVVLSIVRLERPRRSMFGLNVEVEPLSEFWLVADDPAIDDCELAAEPATDGLAVVPVGDALVEPMTEPDVEASLSGMQSMWTGLDECSFALPVSLPASLPAFGLFRLLQSGLVDAVVLPVAALLVVCASTGAALSTAAAMRLRVNVDFMKILLSGKSRHAFFGTGARDGCCPHAE